MRAVLGFSSFLTSAGGQPASYQPLYRQRNRRRNRKRHSSPAGGPARKRRAAEERMIGDLENLSLSSLKAKLPKSRFERWQELEARLAAEPPDDDDEEEEDPDGPDSTRVVLSDELQKIIAAPAPDIVPDVKSAASCTALVLWQPPPALPGEQPTEPPPPPPPPTPTPTPAAATSDDVMAPPPPPAAASTAAGPAYDFSPFCPPAAEQPQTFLFGAAGLAVPAPSADWSAQGTAAFQFGAPAAAAAAPPPFAGIGFGVPLPADDELMEL